MHYRNKEIDNKIIFSRCQSYLESIFVVPSQPRVVKALHTIDAYKTDVRKSDMRHLLSPNDMNELKK